MGGRGEGRGPFQATVRGRWEPEGGRGVPRAEVQAQGGVPRNNPEPMISPFCSDSSTLDSPERVSSPSLGAIAQHRNHVGLRQKAVGRHN